MDKQQLLEEVRALVQSGSLTKDELEETYNSASPNPQDVFRKRVGISEVLYFIGAGIVFIGISILVYQNWNNLNSVTRILVTLGSAIAAYVVGLFLHKDEKFITVSQAFFFISALLGPLGLGVVLYEAGIQPDYQAQTLISALLLTVYLGSYFIFRKHIFTLFAIIFGTWLFYSATSWLVGGNPYFVEWKFFAYRTLVAGLSYVLLGYYLAQTSAQGLKGFLYGFGILGFLGSALSLGGWSPSQNIFWELIFPFLAFGTIFLSIQLKSKSFLTFGSVFLMIYILKITSEYFAHGLGWPTALVIAGLLLIATGYYSVRLKNKYMA